MNEQPVPVIISYLTAAPRGQVVDLSWDFWSNETVDRFTLYRRHGSSFPVVVTSGDARTKRSYTDKSVEPGETYYYEVVIRTASGDEFRSLVATAKVAGLATSLSQNFPNPFNPVTSITFVLPEAQVAHVRIYDTQGKLVTTLFEGAGIRGENRLTWDGTNASGLKVGSGVYYYEFVTEKFKQTRKMVLLK